jgi:hypothetical protein
MLQALREETRVQLLGARRDMSLRRLHGRPLSKQAVIAREKANAGSAGVCHIIGSGWSMPETLGSIDPADYVVGYNLAALTGRRFDAYHMERIDERTPGINPFYRAMIEASGQDRAYIKNLHEPRARVEVINGHLDYGCVPYRTFSAGGYFRKGEERALCAYLLRGGGRFLLQYRSSLMLFCVLYALVGFRTIVLHGQDLSGPYFFDVADFPLARELDPRARGVLPPKPASLAEQHPIDRPFRDEPRIVDALPAMVEVLAEHGVALRCASANSPIARYCPVYRT